MPNDKGFSKYIPLFFKTDGGVYSVEILLYSLEETDEKKESGNMLRREAL